MWYRGHTASVPDSPERTGRLAINGGGRSRRLRTIHQHTTSGAGEGVPF